MLKTLTYEQRKALYSQFKEHYLLVNYPDSLLFHQRSFQRNHSPKEKKKEGKMEMSVDIENNNSRIVLLHESTLINARDHSTSL